MKTIGISGSVMEGEFSEILTIRETYLDSLNRDGFAPVLFPILECTDCMDILLEKIDGVVIQGGVDVSPLSYGENPQAESLEFHLSRDRFELKLIEKALEMKIPILGICRGLQIINVFFGGTLKQHLPMKNATVIHHRGKLYKETQHFITTREGSIVRRAFGKEKAIVNSLHHQGIGELGENLIATSFSEDHLTESVEYLGDSYLHGVQFHPEQMKGNGSQYIFEDFLNEVNKRND